LILTQGDSDIYLICLTHIILIWRKSTDKVDAGGRLKESVALQSAHFYNLTPHPYRHSGTGSSPS